MSEIVFLRKEVNYEAIIQSCSAQDLAVEKSINQKQEDLKEYKENLKESEDWRIKNLNRREKHANLMTQLTEILMITNSFEQMHTISNKKMVAVHQELSKIHQEISNDSDNFMSSVNATVAKIQNLSAEFDESSIMEKIAVCNKEIDIFKQEHAYLSNMYETLQENLKLRFNSETNTGTLKILRKIADDSGKLLPGILFRNEEKLALVQKNIEFLTQKINELKVQFSVLG